HRSSSGVFTFLAFLSLSLVVSLILNISHYMKKKKGNMFCELKILFHSLSSYDDYYTEDDPVYGNLNQDILGKKMYLFRGYNKCMSASQMCYASLDHSVKGKRRKPRRNKNPSLQEDREERSSTTATMASKVSIYLNSEQLAAENTEHVEAIHDDPIRLMGLMHTTGGENI
uniref:T cell receptor associated transmembrane adaptor 1 n=1 Tax=Athene cunicularia TaxID=194338 RepID=A0A663NDS2_ATHCN